MENEKLIDEEKLLKFDSERRACALIRRHVSEDLRMKTEHIHDMRTLYIKLHGHSKLQSAEMSKMHVDSMHQLRWTNLEREDLHLSNIQTVSRLTGGKRRGTLGEHEETVSHELLAI